MTLQSREWRERFLRLALLERQQKAQAVADEIARIVQPANLSDMLDEFVGLTWSLTCDYTDSYAHDNGFDKIVLFQDPDTKMKMRLHLWHPLAISGVERQRQNVHNHRWDFSSAVLIGCADNVLYRFAELGESGEEFFHYRYYARGSKSHYEVEEIGKATLVHFDTEHVTSGDVYSINGEVLHRVDVPGDQFVATIIITHENISWVTNDLLSERKMGSQRAALASPAMTPREVVERVEDFRERLGV